MIIFWVFAAGLAGLALLFVVSPILLSKPEASADSIDENQVNMAVFRQQLEELDADLAAGNLEQDQYEAARHDLEKELLLDMDESGGPEPAAQKSGKWAALVLAPAVPALAVALYLMVGDQSAIEKLESGAAVAAQHQNLQGDVPSMDVLVARLAKRMEQEPKNLQGWMMLARSYLAIDQTQAAINAYERARRLAPKEPEVLLGYAKAVAKAEGSFQGKAAELVAAALEIDPNNGNGLWMLGLVEFQQGNHAKAVELWTKLQDQLTPGSEEASVVSDYIGKAGQQGGLPAADPATAAEQPQTAQVQSAEPAPQVATTGGKAIQVQVSLSEELQGRFSPDDTLFVFARALEGPPMPLAVKRLQAKDLPTSLTLDDSMAMMEQMRVSNFAQVVVGARISKSGNAVPQSGDLQGEVQPVTPGQELTVAVVIDSVRP